MGNCKSLGKFEQKSTLKTEGFPLFFSFKIRSPIINEFYQVSRI